MEHPKIDLAAMAAYLDRPDHSVDLLHGRAPALLSALTATRAELDEARAEIERLKVERGEALLWSPWNDHDVLFEQWAKRRAGAGDGEQDTATTPTHPIGGHPFQVSATGNCVVCGGTRRDYAHTGEAQA